MSNATEKQAAAINMLRAKGGVIYMPESSNFQPKFVGKNVRVHSHVWIGDDVSIPDGMKIQAFVFVPNGVQFEQGVFLGPRATFTNDREPPNDMFFPTMVREGAAIGAGAVICPGVTIGRYALIGAGAVVTKNVEPYAIMAGNPARFLRYRKQNEIIDIDEIQRSAQSA